ncbi:MAG: YajQ family cyclic di-GMP-binding protein [Bdellovibrionaceae bacterium]|nr:YajQ family cyclic di-GMP-binding protein [Bdellovibrionales bacterium]MCB9253325.1 YajQ family cyclic di-GMP-binding protein [Pseudobdellovibrionaceae bacterium]
MPSFDIVIEVDLQEVDNAINQAQKEITTRYDFKGSKSKIEWDKKETISLLGDDEYKLKTIVDIVQSKLIKRGISIKNLVYSTPENALGGLSKQKITLQQGIPTEKAKLLVKEIKDSKLKVQPQIQDNQVRVTGKKKDDLQSVMGMVRQSKLDLDFQFVNFRD